MEGCTNRAWPIQPISRFLPKRVGWPCPVRSALKRKPVQYFNSFSIMFYYIFSTTYQKIGDLFCPVHISGLSHSVSPDKISSKRTWRDNWIEIPNRSPKLFSCNGDIFLFLKDVGEVVKDKILSLV